MQAIARVNRVYGEKPGGLIVDLLGLADQLADALATYTQAGGTGEVVRKKDEAVPAEQGTPGWAMAGKVVKHPRFTTVYLPEDVRKNFAADAVDRYSTAFGGRDKFLRRVRYPNFEGLDLAPVLKEAVEAAAKSMASPPTSRGR